MSKHPLRAFVPGLLALNALLLLSGSPAGTEDGQREVAVKRFWTEGKEEVSSEPWEAHWIWMDEEVDSAVMLARRAFNLEAAPEAARLRISATSQYQLYVNGRFVSRGPARSAPHHQSFDDFDVASLLRRGENILAARVHYQEGHTSYHHPGRAGLIVQLDFPPQAGINSVTSGSSWKAHPDPSWDNSAPHISRFHLEVGDRVDLREAVTDWESIDFDDSGWSAATPLLRQVGWPSPQPDDSPHTLTPPWTSLVPRDIPYLQYSELKATRLIVALPVSEEKTGPFALSGKVDERLGASLPGYQQDAGPLVIPEDDSRNWFLLFDLGKVWNGRPKLDIKGPAGTVVEVHSAPYVLDSQFTADIVDSRLVDQITLSGRQDTWEATYFKPVRYLGVLIRGGGPLELQTVGIHRSEYPFEVKGSFRTPEDPWLESYWQAAAETIRVCTTDAYTDNYRERRQYAQTGYYAALGNYWIFGDTALQRRYLRQIAQEQQANGMMPAYAPSHGGDFMVILDSNCLWVRSLRNYLLYSGDEETTRELVPAARKLLELLHSYTNSLGLIQDPPYAYWLDHALLDRRGASFTLNSHYLGALEDFAEVLRWLGEPGEAVFQSRADLLRNSLRHLFWNPGRELFCDALVGGVQSESFSEHANGLALALGIAGAEEARKVAARLLADERHNYVLRESGLVMVTPAMSYFLHAGLCRYGYVRESLRMFKFRFEKMLQPGTNRTLWEEWWLNGSGRSGAFIGGRTRSDAQTESAFPPALFGEFVLGIRPTAPGLEEVTLSYPDSGLNKVEGVLPTPMGNLEVRWESMTAEGHRLLVKIPSGMRVQLDLNSLSSVSKSSVRLNGKTISTSQASRRHTVLREGVHQVEF